MPPRTHTLGEARRFLSYLRTEAGRELRLARHNAGATQQQVADRIGWSKSKVSRIERGVTPRVSLEDLVLVSAVVGLRPSLKWFPTGRPLRDQGQIELLATLTRRMHPSWSHRHEVPMPRSGDLRAADLVSTIPGCRLMTEAIRRFADEQAQTRSAREKQRDLGADRLLIVVEATRANRRAIAAAGHELRHSFPISARSMLASLAAGLDPGGDGILLLPRTPVAAPPRNRPSPPPLVAPDATNSQRTAPQGPPVAPGDTHVT
jgi:transcriptional regulator with XRE-family HTH domain